MFHYYCLDSYRVGFSRLMRDGVSSGVKMLSCRRVFPLRVVSCDDLEYLLSIVAGFSFSRDHFLLSWFRLLSWFLLADH